MIEEPQVCCYCIDGNKVCRKPLLDDGEVWLAIMKSFIEDGFNAASSAAAADEGLAEFKRRFRQEVAPYESDPTVTLV